MEQGGVRNLRATLLLLALALLPSCAGTPAAPDGAAPKIERISPEELQRILPKPAPNLSLDEITSLSKQGAGAEAIIAKIRETGSRYDLTPSQMIELSKQGVDAKVLDAIHAAREQAMRDGVADEINRREKEHRQEVDKLQRQLLLRPYCPYYYDPFWPHPYGYGRYHYWP